MSDNFRSILPPSYQISTYRTSGFKYSYLPVGAFLASGLLSTPVLGGTCEKAPSCSELGYKENICNCTNAMACPFDESWKVCLSGDATTCGTAKTCKDYDESYLSVTEKKTYCNNVSAGKKCECTMAPSADEDGLECYSCTTVAKTCKDYSESYLSVTEKNTYCNNLSAGNRCECTMVSSADEDGLECYSCTQVTTTCKDYDANYLSVAEKEEYCSKVDKGKVCECTEADEQDLYDLGLTCYSSCKMVVTCESRGYYNGSALASLKAKGCEDPNSASCQCASVSNDPEVAANGLTCYTACANKLLDEEECIKKYGEPHTCTNSCFVSTTEARQGLEDEECSQYILDCRCLSGS